MVVDERRDFRVTVLVTESERDALERAARASDRTLSWTVRNYAMRGMRDEREPGGAPR